MNKFLFAAYFCVAESVFVRCQGNPSLEGCYVIAAALALIASAIAELKKGGK